jgi:hypothetical protein
MSLAVAPEELRRELAGFSQAVERPVACVYCGRLRVWWNGTRARGLTALVAGAVVFVASVLCRRVKCGSCGRSWTLRPPGVTPRRQYQLSVVAAGVAELLCGQLSQEQVAERYTTSVWTVRRWLRWVAGVAEPSALAGRLAEAAGGPVLPRVEPLVRSGWERVRGVVRRAAENLFLLEALGVAEGLEPPGLSSVLEGAIGNRDRVTTYGRPLLPELAC